MRRRDEASANAGARETAWRIVEENVDGSKPRRFIAGNAIGSRAKNLHGHAINARGVEMLLPALLLWNHQLLNPIGKIFKAEAMGDCLRFEAEIVNSGRVAWAEQVWQHITAKHLTGVSAGVIAQAEVIDGDFSRSDLEEVSVVEFAAGLGATILRVWEKAPYVSLSVPQVREIWRANP